MILKTKIRNAISHNDSFKKYAVHSTVRMNRTKVCDKGENNDISIGPNCVLSNCNFYISGNNNKVVIGDKCNLKYLEIYIEDHNNTLVIGDRTTVHGKTQLACIEGTSIKIGCDCMFSSNIFFRTGDSHSVTDLQGNRINKSKDIVLEDHVWVGQNAFVGKGAVVKSNSIIGACAVVTKAFDKNNIVIAGNPAKIAKENVNWKRERI